MSPRCTAPPFTLAPFLYPSLYAPRAGHSARVIARVSLQKRCTSTVNNLPESRLNPAPEDFSSPSFADKTELTLYAGRGGAPNGGDGGAGGNIYIQAAYGETSLHKIARKQFVRAGRGKHGQGSAKGGTKGDDVVITVPVGTIVREIERSDPAAEEAMNIKVYQAVQKEKRKEIRLAEEERRRKQKQKALAKAEGEEVDEAEEELEEELEEEPLGRSSRAIEMEEDEDPELDDPTRHKWLLYPASCARPSRPVKANSAAHIACHWRYRRVRQPHFTSKDHPRPFFATKGEDAVTMKIELELKLLADVGLVGLPNAGKSTLLRSLTNSRTRVGNWAFTTLQPNIGTVVLDKYSGRPAVSASMRRNPDGSQDSERRTRFTIADIPGLIEGAHLDRGLGIAFLRHVERAAVLAFVIDLGAGNAVKALDALWREVGLYAQMREEEEHDREVNLLNADVASLDAPPAALDITGKPWFVVATKADLPETQANFRELKAYLESITRGEAPIPAAWSLPGQRTAPPSQ
uniref:OBG-type G domain-containing protein n=1 Tax=Bionectria ochroleuca TaxID=29856 RepID=A0A8H7TVW2_BIOOC